MAFGVLGTVARPLANRWAFNLFITPIHFPTPSSEKELLAKAKQFTFPSQGAELNAYSWGEGPKVLLMHGWAGRVTQFQAIIKPLVDAGYQAVGLEAPAHGKSPGKKTNLYEFSQAILDFVKVHGPLEAAVGHSLGGAAIYLALNKGLEVNKRISISTPSIGDDIIDTFLAKVNAPASGGDYIRKQVQELFGHSFEFFTARVQAKQVKEAPTLIMHGKADREARIIHAEALLEAIPYAEHLFLDELGHTRILKDDRVVKRTMEFIQREAVPHGAEEPALARDLH